MGFTDWQRLRVTNFIVMERNYKAAFVSADVISVHLYSFQTCKLLSEMSFDKFLPMSSWTDEIEANMDPTVMVTVEGPLDLQLLLQVGFKLSVNVIDNCLETVLFVNLVSIAYSIYNRQLEKIHIRVE